MSRFATKLLLLTVVGLSMRCNSARHTFKNYYDALADDNPAQAATYLSNSCKNKLAKLRPNTDLNEAVRIGFMADYKSYKIIQSQQVGDSVLVAIKVTTTDGRVHVFDKGQIAETVSGGNRGNGKKQDDDFRYRLFKIGGQWKVDTPYCRNFN